MLKHLLRKSIPPAFDKLSKGIGVTLVVVALVAFFASTGKDLSGEAFVPASDEQVLEQVSTPNRHARAERVHRLRARVAERPDDLPLALELATLLIEESRATAEPRFKGYAASVLAPWTARTDPAPEALVLRATLRQSDHDFTGAIEDLQRALRVRPHDAQAWVTLATIFQVQGRLDEAERACAPLTQLTSALAAATCHSAVAGLGPDVVAARDRLEHALAKANANATNANANVNKAERVWALTQLGELHARTGNVAEAESTYRAAHAIAPGDRYLLAVWCDLLLAQKRAAEVTPLLEPHIDDDGLLLRLLEAERLLETSTFAERQALLAERFERGRARGDSVHLREEARFALRIEDDAARALQLAVENWRTQREPADARIVLEAALAARAHDEAASVLAHLDATRLADVEVTALAARLRAAEGPQ